VQCLCSSLESLSAFSGADIECRLCFNEQRIQSILEGQLSAALRTENLEVNQIQIGPIMDIMGLR